MTGFAPTTFCAGPSRKGSRSSSAPETSLRLHLCRVACLSLARFAEHAFTPRRCVPARAPTDGRLRRAVKCMEVECGVVVVGLCLGRLRALCGSALLRALVGLPTHLRTALNSPRHPTSCAKERGQFCEVSCTAPSRPLLQVSSRLFHERPLRRSKGIQGLSGDSGASARLCVGSGGPDPTRSLPDPSLRQSACIRNHFGSRAKLRTR